VSNNEQQNFKTVFAYAARPFDAHTERGRAPSILIVLEHGEGLTVVMSGEGMAQLAKDLREFLLMFCQALARLYPDRDGLLSELNLAAQHGLANLEQLPAAGDVVIDGYQFVIDAIRKVAIAVRKIGVVARDFHGPAGRHLIIRTAIGGC
jgi:hypothetical protein